MIIKETEELYNLYIETTGACTDTRDIKEGCMFFALKGDNFDGNSFIDEALNKGAKFSVTDNENLYQKSDNKASLLLVTSVLEWLQKIARYHRRKHKIPVIALTGTNGKTTTKELIAATLSKKFNVLATKGNLNNHIGVPLTLLNINDQTQVAVIEMGASAPGEIEMLTKIVCPSFGLITNVGKAHLAGFGSFDGVKKTKGELYDELQTYRKIAFVNVDNPDILEMAQERPLMQFVPYGVKNDGAKIIKEKGNPYLVMEINNPSILSASPSIIKLNTKLIGDYNADNILAALCISTYFDVKITDAVGAIEHYIPSNNRSQLKDTGSNILIIDAYNANPTSMNAALTNFGTIEHKNKVLILGDMLELGEDSLNEHINMLKKGESINPKQIYLIGKEFSKAYKVISNEIKSNIVLYDKSINLLEYLKENKISNNLILIKGSRGTRLEILTEAL